MPRRWDAEKNGGEKKYRQREWRIKVAPNSFWKRDLTWPSSREGDSSPDRTCFFSCHQIEKVLHTWKAYKLQRFLSLPFLIINSTRRSFLDSETSSSYEVNSQPHALSLLKSLLESLTLTREVPGERSLGEEVSTLTLSSFSCIIACILSVDTKRTTDTHTYTDRLSCNRTDW